MFGRLIGACVQDISLWQHGVIWPSRVQHQPVSRAPGNCRSAAVYWNMLCFEVIAWTPVSVLVDWIVLARHQPVSNGSGTAICISGDGAIQCSHGAVPSAGAQDVWFNSVGVHQQPCQLRTWASNCVSKCERLVWGPSLQDLLQLFSGAEKAPA
jgi:hypothetical protein